MVYIQGLAVSSKLDRDDLWQIQHFESVDGGYSAPEQYQWPHLCEGLDTLAKLSFSKSEWNSPPTNHDDLHGHSSRAPKRVHRLENSGIVSLNLIEVVCWVHSWTQVSYVHCGFQVAESSSVQGKNYFLGFFLSKWVKKKVIPDIILNPEKHWFPQNCVVKLKLVTRNYCPTDQSIFAVNAIIIPYLIRTPPTYY